MDGRSRDQHTHQALSDTYKCIPLYTHRIQARATFFGAPEYFSDAYAVRGEGSFGDILYGSCGYFEQQGTLPVRPTDVPCMMIGVCGWVFLCGVFCVAAVG